MRHPHRRLCRRCIFLRGRPILSNDKRVVGVGTLLWEPEGTAPAANVQELEPRHRKSLGDPIARLHYELARLLHRPVKIRHTDFFRSLCPCESIRQFGQFDVREMPTFKDAR